MNNVFIAGCGYIGERIARLSRDSGVPVTCLVRSPERAGKLRSEGFPTVMTALDDEAAIPAFAVDGSILYYLVPPPGGGNRDPRARNFIAKLSGAGRPLKVVYMSATSVYSESGGGVVTEESPTVPASAMGRRRLDAEKAFREYGEFNDVPVVILRVSGIYGPGRLPQMQISQGLPLLREDQSGPGNRIHADDLAALCMAAAQGARDGDVFNVSDGHPTSMTHYFNCCADMLNLPRQPQVPLEVARQVMSPLMFSYVSESRIVDNSRILTALGFTLRYTCIEDGLAASH